MTFDGTHVWVGDPQDDTVIAVNASSREVAITDFVTSGCSPAGLAFDGTYLWVACNALPSVLRLVPTSTGTETAFPVGFNSSGIAFDGTSIWVSGGTSLTKLDPGTGTVQGSYTVAEGGTSSSMGSLSGTSQTA